MSIYLGNTEIGSLYLGNTEIGQAYLGSNMVFSKQSPPVSITVNPSSYDSTNSVFQQFISGHLVESGYTDSNSTTYAGVQLKNGSNAVTNFYWKFDLSSIPQDAVINSVSLTVKACMSIIAATVVSDYYMVVCNGTTEVGSHKIVSNAAVKYNMDVGTGWTRESLQNISILFHAQRTTADTTKSYHQRFFGADLTITYSTN